MDYSQTFAISAAGMAAERTRVEVAALNLANANAVQTEGAAKFQPLRAVIRATQGSILAPGEFAGQVDAGLDAPEVSNWNLSLPQVSVEASGSAPRSVYEPGNPFADAKGYVNYPGVDTATEMVNMMSALRSYEANVAAMNTARTLALKALDIGGTGA